VKLVVGAALSVAAIGVLTFLWASECSGPSPEVVSAELEEPASEGDPFVVRAVIENRGRGPGTVSVEFRLRAEDGQTFKTKTVVDLESRETITVSEEIHAPPGAEYEASARVDYPVR
jgi:hypothetical protein